MGKVVNFNNEEHCECHFCQLAHNYIDTVRNITSDEELFDVLREIISIAENLSLVDYLQQENEHNAELINHLLYGCEEE